MKHPLLLTALLAAAIPATAGDGAREHASVTDPTLPRAGGLHLSADGAWSEAGERSRRTTGFDTSLGLTPRLALELRAERDDAPWRDELGSVRPSLLVGLTPPGSRLRATLRAGHTFADEDIVAGADTVATATPVAAGFRLFAGHTVICGPEFGPDAPPCDAVVDNGSHDHPVNPVVVDPVPDAGTPMPGATPAAKSTKTTATAKRAATSKQTAASTSTATSAPGAAKDCGCDRDSVFRHGIDAFSAVLALEADLGPETRLAANLLHLDPEGDGAAWGYAAALRRDLTPRFSAGVEAAGDLDRHAHQEAGLSLRFQASEALSLQAGSAWGLTDHTPDRLIRAAITLAL